MNLTLEIQKHKKDQEPSLNKMMQVFLFIRIGLYNRKGKDGLSYLIGDKIIDRCCIDEIRIK